MHPQALSNMFPAAMLKTNSLLFSKRRNVPDLIRSGPPYSYSTFRVIPFYNTSRSTRVTGSKSPSYSFSPYNQPMYPSTLSMPFVLISLSASGLASFAGIQPPKGR